MHLPLRKLRVLFTAPSFVNKDDLLPSKLFARPSFDFIFFKTLALALLSLACTITGVLANETANNRIFKPRYLIH